MIKESREKGEKKIQLEQTTTEGIQKQKHMAF